MRDARSDGPASCARTAFISLARGHFSHCCSITNACPSVPLKKQIKWDTSEIHKTQCETCIQSTIPSKANGRMRLKPFWDKEEFAGNKSIHESL